MLFSLLPPSAAALRLRHFLFLRNEMECQRRALA